MIMVNIYWKEIFSKTSYLDRFLILFLILGLAFLSAGIFKGIVEDSQVQVEVLNDEDGVSPIKIVVDVGGGVVSPGVYELVANSRIKDALVMAGGLAKDADRNYVQRNINLAEPLTDGRKIFIPTIGSSVQGVGYSEANSSTNLVNINLADEKTLDTLSGIGEAKAQAIIKNRPYKGVDELVSKGVLSQAGLNKIKDKIVAF